MTETFRTGITVPASSFRISHHSPVLCTGSCFTGNIGGKLETYRFPVLINPAGIQYNPASIARTLRRTAEGTPYREEELSFANGLWFSYDHHSSFSSPDKQTCLENINYRLDTASGFLRRAQFLCITFGTAYAYSLRETGLTVSNCHKQPAELFDRRFLGPEEIVELLLHLHAELSLCNPGLRYIFTVSPVRHLKDGFPENQRSKASLLLAVHELCCRLNAEYFPSYEIVLDDLRDYRFFNEDMVHPNSTAADYIWGHFMQAYMDEETRTICRELDPVLQSLAHRPFNPGSEAHRRFLAALDEKIDVLEEKYPFLDLRQQKPAAME